MQLFKKKFKNLKSKIMPTTRSKSKSRKDTNPDQESEAFPNRTFQMSPLPSMNLTPFKDNYEDSRHRSSSLDRDFPESNHRNPSPGVELFEVDQIRSSNHPNRPNALLTHLKPNQNWTNRGHSPAPESSYSPTTPVLNEKYFVKQMEKQLVAAVSENKDLQNRLCKREDEVYRLSEKVRSLESELRRHQTSSTNGYHQTNESFRTSSPRPYKQHVAPNFFDYLESQNFGIRSLGVAFLVGVLLTSLNNALLHASPDTNMSKSSMSTDDRINVVIREWNHLPSRQEDPASLIFSSESHIRQILHELDSYLSHTLRPRVFLIGIQPNLESQVNPFMQKLIDFILAKRTIHRYSIQGSETRKEFDAEVYDQLESNVVFLDGVDKLRGPTPLSLQVISDKDSGPAKNAVILMTVMLDEENLRDDCQASVEKHLRDKWISEELKIDQVNPIISRITALAMCI